jgi:glycosyltransferase involved in cell wall biosynthesis
MKLLYIVQRYGDDIVGGSEAACRQFAEALVRSGHEVEVLTSCARSYVTWEDSYAPGIFNINGVTVHRLQVLEPRKPERFGPTDTWLMSEKASPSLFEHQRWARLMGPDLVGMRTWLIDNAHRFDAAIFMTYLYTNATCGIPVLAGRLPIVFQPTAHDEPPIKIPLFESTFRLVDSYLFFTPEERDVVRDRVRIEPEGRVVGIGIEMNPPTGNPDDFRTQFGLGEDPYLVYVGRLDPMKGVKQLCDFFVELKKHYPSKVKLVLAGDPLIELPQHDDIVITGFLDEEMKQAAIAGSLALIQSSYFESFSIVLCEAWVQRRPALVQGASTVLRGQAMRSTGAIPYEGYAEFEQAVLMLLENPTLADEMGLNGRAYVEQTYAWDSVLTGFEESLEIAKKNFAARPIRLCSSDEGKISESVNSI